MSWISMSSFHQRLLSTSHKNNYSTSLWTLHEKEGTHPHPILLQFFWFKKIQKKLTRNETKQNESLKQTGIPHHLYITFQKTPQGFCPTTKTKNGHFVRRKPSSENPPSNHRPKLPKAPAEAAVFSSCHRGHVEKPTSLTTFTGQVCAYLEVWWLEWDGGCGCGLGLGLGKVFWKPSFFW